MDNYLNLLQPELERDYYRKLEKIFNIDVLDKIITSNVKERSLPKAPVYIQEIGDDIASLFKLSGKVEIYVNESEIFNAFSGILHKTGAKIYPVILNSYLIKNLNIEELIFIIGHELGHVLLGHNRVNRIVSTVYKDNMLPPYVQYYYNLWRSVIEISADRIAFFGARDINIAVSLLHRLAGNNLDDFMLNRIDALKVFSKTTLFENGFINKNKDVKLDQYIKKLFDNLYSKEDKYNETFVSLLRDSGLLIATIDGELSVEERSFILNRLARYMGIEDLMFSDEELVELDRSVLQENIKRNAQLLKTKFPDKIQELFLNIAVLMFKDKQISTKEYNFLINLGSDKLGMDKDVINRILYNIVSSSNYFFPYSETDR